MKGRLLAGAAALLCAALVCAGALAQGAQIGETPYTSGDYSYTVSDGKAVITAYAGAETLLTIPSSLGGVPVVEIGAYAFSGKASLVRAVVPEGVETIGEGAFTYCANLTGIELPRTLKVISRYAFEACSSLRDVQIPNGMEEIQQAAFRYCTSLVRMELPPELRAVGEEAFSGCSSLSEIVIPETLPSFSGSAVWDTPWLAAQTDEFVIVGDSILIRYQGDAARVQVPYSVRVISAAFYGNKRIESVVIPGTVNEIDEKSFADCELLRSVELSEGLRSIRREAFSGCTSLSGLTAPATLETIGAFAFQNCVSLEYADLSSGVVDKIEEYAFSGCRSLREAVIPEQVDEVPTGCFYACSALGSVELHSGVQEIGAFAFASCLSLTRIDFPDMLKAIGECAFMGSGLTQADLPRYLTALPSQAFAACPALKSVFLYDRLHDIAPDAFMGDNAVMYVEPDSDALEAGYSFGWTMSYMPRTVRNWRYVASEEDVTLTGWIEDRREAEPPTKIDGRFVTVIGEGAFAGSGMARLSVPRKVREIGAGAFSGCAALEQAALPDGLERIGERAFSGCAALSSLEIPASVTMIGEDAFSGCASLTLLVREGSYAQRYAVERGIAYALCD